MIKQQRMASSLHRRCSQALLQQSSVTGDSLCVESVCFINGDSSCQMSLSCLLPSGTTSH